MKVNIIKKDWREKNSKVDELLFEQKEQLSYGEYKDSAHQIQVVTTRKMILEMTSK